MMKKILNLYCGIGGNRKLWGNSHDITAVELDPKIAKIYQDFFPNDKVVVADAHQYLLEHFEEYDFIWSSPPCPSHSKVRFVATREAGGGAIKQKPIYPSMMLYEEILFLQNYLRKDVKFCVENVIAFYKPLIEPQQIGKHYFWTNFLIRNINTDIGRGHDMKIEELAAKKKVDIKKIEGLDKRLVLRNCVEPEIGLHIFQEAFKNHTSLFDEENS